MSEAGTNVYKSLNNQKSNLRHLSHSHNVQNGTPFGSSKYKGVSWNAHRSKWIAQAGMIKRYIGGFDTEEEAAIAYDAEAKRLYGNDCYTNFGRAHGRI